MNTFEDTFNHDLDNKRAAGLDFDIKEPLDIFNKGFSTETLIAAYRSIAMS
jgi:hypothetical protein